MVEWGRRILTVSIFVPTAIYCLLHDWPSKWLLLFVCGGALFEYCFKLAPAIVENARLSLKKEEPVLDGEACMLLHQCNPHIDTLWVSSVPSVPARQMTFFASCAVMTSASAFDSAAVMRESQPSQFASFDVPLSALVDFPLHFRRCYFDRYHNCCCDTSCAAQCCRRRYVSHRPSQEVTL
jgi:hypothetical protein